MCFLATLITPERLFCTVGCHPTRATEPEEHPGGPSAYFEEMRAIAQEGTKAGKVVAVGECGLGEVQ